MEPIANIEFAVARRFATKSALQTYYDDAYANYIVWKNRIKQLFERKLSFDL